MEPVPGAPAQLDASPVVGYVPGVYDLFHVGHLNILRSAKKYCDVLIAGVVTDELCETRKGFRPTVPLDERMEIVSEIRPVDVVEAEDCSKLEMWQRLRFDVLIKGDDWKGTDKGRLLEADMAAVGVRVAYLPYTRVTSSTQLRAALRTA